MTTLHLKKPAFRQFLSNLSKINDCVILDVSSDTISGIVTSQDNTLFLWAELAGDFDGETSLNIPSLTKLEKALGLVPDDFTIDLNSNRLEYAGNNVKFKYHLYDNGVITRPKLSLKKIQSFEYDIEFSVDNKFMALLLKTSLIFKNSKKLYIYTEDDHLVWSLADRTMTNNDEMTIIGNEVDFELDEFILNLDNVRLFAFENSPATLKINSKLGIGNLNVKSSGVELNYIVSSLTK